MKSSGANRLDIVGTARYLGGTLVNVDQMEVISSMLLAQNPPDCRAPIGAQTTTRRESAALAQRNGNATHRFR